MRGFTFSKYSPAVFFSLKLLHDIIPHSPCCKYHNKHSVSNQKTSHLDMAARLAAAVRCHSRSLSTASEFIRGPVQVFGIEGRYAHALYSAATKAGSADSIESQLNSLQVSIANTPNTC